jgi:hypothetical protein
MVGTAARIRSRGDEVISSERLQPQWSGMSPTRLSPPRTPIIAENSKMFRRTEAPGPRSSSRSAMSPLTVPSVNAKPRINRPSTRTENDEDAARTTVPAIMSAGDAQRVAPR